MRKVAFSVGLVEAVSLVAFAASVVINAHRDHSTVGSPPIQAAIYCAFAAGIAALSFGIRAGKTWPRTPFAMVQVFSGIIAYTLASGTGTEAKTVGLVLFLIAFVGIYAIFKND